MDPPKIARMPLEAAAQAVLPFSALLLAIFAVGYVYMEKLLQDVILPRVYGRLFAAQDEDHGYAFSVHHNTLITHGLLTLLGIVPTMCILVGDAAFNDPLISGSGGHLRRLSALHSPGLLWRLPMAKLHHVIVLLVALSTIGLNGDIEKNHSATVSTYMILVWYTWDMVSELPIHAGLILWRCVRDYASAPALSKLMRYMALWRLASVLGELCVTVYLFYSAWRKFSTTWTVLAPMACWLWFYLQLQGAHVLYGISCRVRREHAVRARSDKEGGGSNAMSLVEEGAAPQRHVLQRPGLRTRSHLLMLAAGALVIGGAMLLVRYFTQDSSAMAGIAARGLQKPKRDPFRPPKRPPWPGNERGIGNDVLERAVAANNTTGIVAAVSEAYRQAHAEAPVPSNEEPSSIIFPQSEQPEGRMQILRKYPDPRKRDEALAPSAEDSSSGLFARKWKYCSNRKQNNCAKIHFRDVEPMPNPEEHEGNGGVRDTDKDLGPVLNNYRGILAAVSEALREARSGAPAVDTTATGADAALVAESGSAEEEATEMEKMEKMEEEEGTGDKESGIRQRRRRNRDEEPNTCVQEVARATGHGYDEIIMAVQAGIDANVHTVADLNRMAEELDCQVVDGEVRAQGVNLRRPEFGGSPKFNF
ncbi:hypothetical protein PG997_014893 [Apiospora hydei]|uniref:TLC domain-containing protein n=1 Tax=Apiospora hydei TaxID=1337664 RepID=A0ABR1UXL9_9PEZI